MANNIHHLFTYERKARMIKAKWIDEKARPKMIEVETFYFSSSLLPNHSKIYIVDRF